MITSELIVLALICLVAPFIALLALYLVNEISNDNTSVDSPVIHNTSTVASTPTKKVSETLPSQRLFEIYRANYMEVTALQNARAQLEKERYAFYQEHAAKQEKLKELSRALSIERQNLVRDQHVFSAEKANFSKQRSRALSNLEAIPYYARIIADYDTRGLDILAAQLNWGTDQQRLKKVKSILEIKRETQTLIASYKESEYQLAYLLQLFPALEDYITEEYSPDNALPSVDLLAESYDTVRFFLSKEEYEKLSPAERNQLALDRYWKSHRRTNWQVGRDYESYIGYQYVKKGYTVEYYGSLHGLEDLGRDLIATKAGDTLIIQCKYWSAQKQIHEKHINQLYGTVAAYCFETGKSPQNVRGVFVTNITLSHTAKQFANYLGIKVVELHPLAPYPCIKCNINRTTGSKIYHLPFDQQYDSCKIDAHGEFMAMTVAEAEAAGFRRAYRWHSGVDA